MSRLHHLLTAYRHLRQYPEPVVLATIVETFGSTYQKAGARMLIDLDGELTGLLGGGCFERDLIEHAHSVFDSGDTKTVFYDMRSPDDAVWGLGLGCNGAVRIFLQLLTAADDFSPLNLIAEAADARQPGNLVTITESAHPDFAAGHSLFLPVADKLQPWPFSLAALPQKPLFELHSIGGHEFQAFYDPLQPPTHLLILGAGDDAKPLVRCAKALGWRVSVADHRPAYLNDTRFPQADLLLHVQPQALGNHLDLNHFSVVVVMTHNLDHDRRYLAALADTKIPYIGLLGPTQRRERLLQSLGNSGEYLSERVHGPLGLDIGAETPEEIALAIVAGIHAELKGRSGGQLILKNNNTYLQACHPQ